MRYSKVSREKRCYFEKREVLCLVSLNVRKTWDSRDFKIYSKGYSSDDKRVLFYFHSTELKVTSYAKKNTEGKEVVIFNLQNHNQDKQ